MSRFPRITLPFLFFLATLLTACGGGGGSTSGDGSGTAGGGSGGGGETPPPAVATLTSISVSPAPLTLARGTSQQMTATGTYSDGSQKTITAIVSWSSSNPDAVTITGNGLAQFVAIGDSTISATLGAVTGTSSVSATEKAGWYAATNMATKRGAQVAVLLNDGRVLVAGGYQGSGSSSYAISAPELYDPATDSWSAATDYTPACSGGSGTLLDDGKVLLLCGTQARLYDPDADSWTSTGSSSWSHSWGHLIRLGTGKFLATAGQFLTTCELYNPTNGTWSPAGYMSVLRSNYTATLLTNGKVLVSGGDDLGTSAIPVSHASAELYDPATNSWSAAASMSTARSSHTATLLADGRVLVTGGLTHALNGSGSQTSTPLASAEIYDPATDSWSATGSMGTTRYAHSSVRLGDGRVLSIEGTTGSAGNSSELYDPATGTWSSGGSPASTRKMQFTATLLQDGSVLVVGGKDSSDVITGVDRYY